MNCRPTETRSSFHAPGVLLALALALTFGCSKASPTAPSGSTLSLIVNPVNIVAPTGSATATATLRRPNGTPQAGAQVQFSTTLGTFSPTLVATDSNGMAVATLTGDGRVGTAKVMAFSGAVMSTEVDVMLGTPAASISLSAIPSTVKESGGTVKLLALVRDAQGNPVPDSPVNFSTQAGTLNSKGNFVFTDATGTARDTLKLTSIDLQNQAGDTFNVGVQGSAATPVTFAVNIARPPLASFTANAPVGSLTVAFTDTSTHHPTSWFWTFGNPASGSANTSNQQNPAHTYTKPGNFIVTLTVSNAVGSNSASQVVTNTGTAP